jgi:hypothetical protein
MKKQQVIDLIVEMSATNPEMSNSILGSAIVNAANECNDQNLNIQQLKANFEAGLYLIEQIKICENDVQDLDMIRQRTKFYLSLHKILNEL